MPLRSQRGYAAAQRSAVHTLAALAEQLGNEAAANGYLLARGLAECYWGRLATRMRQDAYTDLVAVAVTSVPTEPGYQKHTVENAVRRRLLTPATSPRPTDRWLRAVPAQRAFYE